MSDFINSFAEVAFSRLRPLFTLPRLLYCFVVLLIISPASHLVLTAELLATPTKLAVAQLGDAIFITPFWKFSLVCVTIFGVIPSIASQTVALFAKKVHIKRAQRLIQNLADIRTAPDAMAMTMKYDQMAALKERKRNGLQKLEFHKMLGEALIYLEIAMCLAILLDAIAWWRGAGILAISIYGTFAVSRNMLLCFLGDVKPYDVWSERLLQIP